MKLKLMLDARIRDCSLFVSRASKSDVTYHSTSHEGRRC